jgi:hypothetical protein
MSDLDAYRARYRAAKRAKQNSVVKRARGVIARKTKADRRARAYIERWLAGETYQQIADSEGICVQGVGHCIAKYRKRHPDTPIPHGPQKHEALP